ncbi:MAG TPA: S-adenosylmethionine:tRNA ribosyltransferase-isomerase [Chitinophagaceae bacterium]|nr:S-adenosylmethionine:tRNA ribosyltransferase-isomerase [Chitinophagaceae bacterium]
MHPKNISIADFNYALPTERIATHPLPERDSSRLLIYKNGNITQDVYRNLGNHLPENSLLLFNDTRVIEARLIFQKPTGGNIEIFCLEPHQRYADITSAMLQQGKVWWQCLVGGASKWKPGQVLEKKIGDATNTVVLRAAYVEKNTGHFTIELSWSPADLTFAEILHHAGAIPLPPYIKRKVEASDSERYQTVYARTDGSVAAPTAGLHFTKALFDSLAKKNIATEYLTLHVGAGTFKPVKAATMEDHEMHAEFIDVTKKTIEKILAHLRGPVIAVGTTSLRTIESLYWLGVLLQNGKQVDESSGVLELGQWDAYECAQQDVPAENALRSLLDWMDEHASDNLIAKTRIIIAPGYKPRIAQALITNFHQPQSTLLLLLAALVGEDWRKIYDYAMENDFRFLSYGDGSLIQFGNLAIW